MSFIHTCPNCGPREIEELRCAGEVTTRPPGAPSVRDLNAYIYFRANKAGVHREWWFCRTCEEWFLAERDTRTNEVLRTWLPEGKTKERGDPMQLGAEQAQAGAV